MTDRRRTEGITNPQYERLSVSFLSGHESSNMYLEVETKHRTMGIRECSTRTPYCVSEISERSESKRSEDMCDRRTKGAHALRGFEGFESRRIYGRRMLRRKVGRVLVNPDWKCRSNL